jgi:hypothetical protein
MPLIVQLCTNDQEEMQRTLLNMIAAFCQSMLTPDSVQQTKDFGRGLAREGKISHFSILIRYFNSSLCNSVLYQA